MSIEFKAAILFLVVMEIILLSVLWNLPLDGDMMQFLTGGKP
jgi:hypothetical protein